MHGAGQVLLTATSATAEGNLPAFSAARAIRRRTACKLAAIVVIILRAAGKAVRRKNQAVTRAARPAYHLGEIIMDISELLAFAVKNKASGLHLSAGLPPMIRVHGDVRRINLPPMEHKDVHAMVYDIMNDGQRKFYEENLECDFSFAIPNLARFRVNAFVQQRGAAAVMRTIPSKVLTLDELKCPKI